MADKLSIQDLPIKDSKVLMRVDFNVPLDPEGHIVDDTRIVSSLPSINFVLESGGALILMSHLGRPKEKHDRSLSLKPCAKRLATLLGKDVTMAPDCVGPKVEKMVRDLKPGDVLLLENLRFHPGEEHPEANPAFVKQLAKLGDFYVNDAFGSAHRAHASTANIAYLFPGKAAAGFLLQKEIQFLGNLMVNPNRPFVAILGGAKVSTKIGVIEALLKKADKVLVGGGMAFTFLKAQGIPIGDSIHEDSFLDKARQILAANSKGNLILPLDFVIADKVESEAHIRTVDFKEGISSGFRGVDIGPKTIAEFSQILQTASTVLWNGPLGICEIAAFAKGTECIASVLAKLKATSVVGGGDSIAALQALGLADRMTHLSTGGGASLEYLEFGTLPGLEALSVKERMIC